MNAFEILNSLDRISALLMSKQSEVWSDSDLLSQIIKHSNDVEIGRLSQSNKNTHSLLQPGMKKKMELRNKNMEEIRAWLDQDGAKNLDRISIQINTVTPGKLWAFFFKDLPSDKEKYLTRGHIRMFEENGISFKVELTVISSVPEDRKRDIVNIETSDQAVGDLDKLKHTLRDTQWGSIRGLTEFARGPVRNLDLVEYGVRPGSRFPSSIYAVYKNLRRLISYTSFTGNTSRHPESAEEINMKMWLEESTKSSFINEFTDMRILIIQGVCYAVQFSPNPKQGSNPEENTVHGAIKFEGHVASAWFKKIFISDSKTYLGFKQRKGIKTLYELKQLICRTRWYDNTDMDIYYKADLSGNADLLDID
jgi:hypothetical protein